MDEGKGNYRPVDEVIVPAIEALPLTYIVILTFADNN
jgi:hypothetical protein